MYNKEDILFCNITLQNSKRQSFELKEQVFSDIERKVLKWNDLNDRRLINRVKQKEDLKIVSVEVIKTLGRKHKNKSYTEVKKNDNNQRNKITGAYE